jgi:hypothetical protein
MRIYETTVNASAQISACFDSPSTNDGSQGLFRAVLPPSAVHADLDGYLNFGTTFSVSSRIE